MKHLLSIVMAVMLAAITSARAEISSVPISLSTTTNTLDDESVQLRGQLVAIELSPFYNSAGALISGTATVVIVSTPRYAPETIIYSNASYTQDSSTNFLISGGYYSAGEVFTLRVSDQQTNMVLKALLKYIK